MRATFENIMVLVDGLPEGSLVSLGIDEEGLIIGGYGMLSWEGSSVALEDLAPKGLRMTVGIDGFNPSVFFIPVSSMGDNGPIDTLMREIERSAADAGATVDSALTTA
jgi:hypothetical protein